MIPPPPHLTLADLPRILVGRVLGVDGTSKFSERLRELGFCCGTEVRFERQAPFGGQSLLASAAIAYACADPKPNAFALKAWPILAGMAKP